MEGEDGRVDRHRQRKAEDYKPSLAPLPLAAPEQRDVTRTCGPDQQRTQSSLKERLYIVLSTVFSIFFQSDRRWMNS